MKKVNDSKNWADQEFRLATFGDKRLHDRLIKSVNQISFCPDKTINAAFEDHAATKACYRFFDNNSVTKEKILKPHIEQTHKRMAKHPVVLAIQDTTYYEFNKHTKTEGLGSIGKYPNMENPVQGLIGHATLAFSPAGIPLGLLGHDIWARPEKGIGQRGKDIPVEEKESFKWIRSLDDTMKFDHDQTQVITLGDRECDFFEFYDAAKNYHTDFIIRSKHDRKINGGDHYLSWHMKNQESVGNILVETKVKGKKKREAIVSLSFSKVSFDGAQGGRVELHVVSAVELNPPEGMEALDWRLLTTLPIYNKEDAEIVIGFYKMRWHIESYFKVLKTGCKVEDCRLETKERLEKYITLLSIVAWRLYWMTHIGRYSPNEECDIVLTDSEWKALWTKKNRDKIKRGLIDKRPPQKKMTVKEAIRSIAMMGGFNGRKGDGEPGMISIWRGWIRLQDMTEMWEIMS